MRSYTVRVFVDVNVISEDEYEAVSEALLTFDRLDREGLIIHVGEK
jgi:hypothetical protein